MALRCREFPQPGLADRIIFVKLPCLTGEIVAKVMKKIKYFYNPNTLRYEKLETPLRVKLLRVLGFLSASIVTALIIVSIAYRLFPSVNEKRLMRENEALSDNFRLMDAKVQKL